MPLAGIDLLFILNYPRICADDKRVHEQRQANRFNTGGAERSPTGNRARPDNSKRYGAHRLNGD
jgi:hypothetical protein